jgi:hypothetical protein
MSPELYGVSAEAALVLYRLIGAAATAMGAGRRPEIPIGPANYSAFVRTPQELKSFPSRLAELRLRGLVKRVDPYGFSICPHLWKMAARHPEDDEWFPLDAP